MGTDDSIENQILHYFSPNENISFYIRTGFFQEDGQFDPYTLRDYLVPLNEYPDNWISEFLAGDLVMGPITTPPYALTYNYTTTENKTFNGIIVYTVNELANAGFQFTFEADSSVYEKHYPILQRVLASFRSNDGQPC
jgi:hypothetical protein